MRCEKKGRNFGRENEEIMNKKKWEYEKQEIIIWKEEE